MHSITQNNLRGGDSGRALSPRGSPGRLAAGAICFPVETVGLSPAPLPRINSPTVAALAEQKRRIVTLNRIELFVKTGHSKLQAARMAGVNPITAWRWRKLRDAGGDDALLPQTNRCGRRARFNVPDSTIGMVEALALQHGSSRAAWLKFARSKDCPPQLACAIRPRTRHVPQRLLDLVKIRRIPAILLAGPTRFALFTKEAA